jgi:protein-S-isoprenylcysteine O-methyltransferase Ste14
MMPPRIALIAMVAIIILHVTVPPIIVPAPFSYTSVAVMAAGVAMIGVVTAGFQAAATLITPFTESTALIRHGFRGIHVPRGRTPRFWRCPSARQHDSSPRGSCVFRNPAGGLYPRHEQRALEQRFDEEYRNCRRSVRRWL